MLGFGKPSQDKRCFQTITLEELGLKPMKVSEGTSIHCMVKVVRDDYDQRRHTYGSGGYEEDIKTIEDQDVDFSMKYSQYNDNSTSADWG